MKNGTDVRQAARSGGSMRQRLVLGGGTAALVVLGGCQADSFMADNSVSGRWERTPTVLPILDRIAAIEDYTGDQVEYAEPGEADMLSIPKLYRLAPGDTLRITIYDIVTPGSPEDYERAIDSHGNVDIPQLGQVYINGLTIDETRQVIEEKVRRLVPEPLVAVVPLQQRRQTFTILGGVAQPGQYFVPNAEYRLLEAITAGGTFDSNGEYVYVIRQVMLSDDARGLKPPAIPGQGEDAPAPKGPTGSELIDIIDDLSKPRNRPGTEVPPPDSPKQPGSPAMMNRDNGLEAAARRPRPARDPHEPAASPAAMRHAGQPPIDLVEPGTQPKPAPQPAAIPPQSGEPQWVFINGRWTQARRTERGTVETLPPAAGSAKAAQRVIRVPMQGLLEGRREYNIIVRPGDIVRIPTAPRGLVYLEGQVGRTGPYGLPETGKLTLTRAIISAGGLSTLAVPERCDITRMVGPDREATVMLDFRAIKEKTQPDIYLKPNDVINIGTNFWALPMAVIRNGFRASYGFGFILDRNFGNDIFGAPPANRFGQ